MKHCSQGSSNCVKNANTCNHTLISQTQIQRKILLGFLYLRETFPGGHLMGVLKCHQLTPPNKMVQLNPQAVPEKLGWIHGWSSNWNLSYG
jgi:hypothetical protein